ncbi:MAG TPA: type II toxin-antitoxin system VapC family toxin [Rhizomicrobium sp.]
MIVIDASAAVAILLGEKSREELIKKLSASTEHTMSPISYAELVMALARTYSQPKAAADTFLAETRISIGTIDQEQSRFAVHAFLFYGKGRHPARLNLGDCFSYAAAKALNAPLLYVGDDFSKTDIRTA